MNQVRENKFEIIFVINTIKDNTNNKLTDHNTINICIGINNYCDSANAKIFSDKSFAHASPNICTCVGIATDNTRARNDCI